MKPRAAGRTVPGLGRLVANLVARCHCSVRVRSCHLRCDWLQEYFCCWRGDMWIGESVSNNRCGEGYRLTDRTRQTCLRITIAARFIRNGHAHRAMRVKFPARFFNRLARTTTSTQGLRSFDSRRSSAATYISLGDAADLLDVFPILNHKLHR